MIAGEFDFYGLRFFQRRLCNNNVTHCVCVVAPPEVLNPTVLQWSELQSLDEDRFVGAQTRNVITGQVVVVSGLPLSEPTRSISVPGDRAEGKICYVKDQNRTACEISVK